MEGFYFWNPKITKDVLLYYGFRENDQRVGYYYSELPDYELRSGSASDLYPQTIVYHLEGKRVFLQGVDSRYMGDFPIERLNDLKSFYKLITGWTLNPQHKYAVMHIQCACGHLQRYKIPHNLNEPLAHACKCGQKKSLYHRERLQGIFDRG